MENGKKTDEISFERQNELLENSKALIEFIRKNYTPETMAIVTGVGVTLVNTEMTAIYGTSWN